MSDRIGLLLEPSTLRVQAGGEAVVASITVENRTTIVDQYALSLEGLEPDWYELASTAAGLFPGEKAQVRLAFHLPRTTEISAGTLPFSIKAVSRANPEDYSVIEGSLEVLRFGAASLEMSPERLEGRRAATQLLFRNPANAPTLLALQVTDAEEGLDYRFSTDAVTIPAGGETTVSLTLWPKRRPLLGPPHEYPFRVAALELEQRVEETPLAVEGVFTYRPPLANFPNVLGALWRRLRPVLPLLLSLIALLLALLALLKPPPTIETPTLPVPPPVVQSFRSEAGPGGTLQLKWQVQGAQQVRIDGTEVDPRQGSRTIDRLETKEYTLEASSEGGTVRQRLGVVVLKPPTVVGFEAQPAVVEPGQSTTLSWKVDNATRVTIDGTPVTQPSIASGKKEEKPEQTRDYVLVAENDAGWVVRRATVTVKAK